MFKKLILASALIALPLMLDQQEASAGGGISFNFGSPGYGYGGHSYAPRAISPYHSAYRGYPRTTSHSYNRGFSGGYSGAYGIRYRGPSYSSGYRSGYGGYGGGSYCPSRGYGSPYNRGGVSLRFGF